MHLQIGEDLLTVQNDHFFIQIVEIGIVLASFLTP